MLGLSDFLIDLLLPKRGTWRPVSGGGPPPGVVVGKAAANGGEGCGTAACCGSALVC